MLYRCFRYYFALATNYCRQCVVDSFRYYIKLSDAKPRGIISLIPTTVVEYVGPVAAAAGGVEVPQKEFKVCDAGLVFPKLLYPV